MVEPITDFEIPDIPSKNNQEIRSLLRQSWFEFAKELIIAIRQEDTQTPIIIGGSLYCSAVNLSCIDPNYFKDFKNIVFAVHQYEPEAYVYQENKYAKFECKNGVAKPIKPSGDNANLEFKPEFKTELLKRYQWINGFKYKTDEPAALTINEYGVNRWARAMNGEKHAPDAYKFLDAEMKMIESIGANHALWLWEVDDCIGYDSMNLRHGENPRNHHFSAVKPDDKLIGVIKANWSLNKIFATEDILSKLHKQEQQ